MSWFGDYSLTPIQDTISTGGWYRTSNQTVSTTGAPSFVSLSWTTPTGDTTTISQNIPNGSAFTVNKHGIYSFSLQAQYANLNTATLTDTSFRLVLNCNRKNNTGAIISNTFDFPNNTPTNPTHQLNGSFELNVGDILTFQTIQYLSAGSFQLQGRSVAPLDFDLNTFFTWTLLKELP